jgi:hypothetical protein
MPSGVGVMLSDLPGENLNTPTGRRDRKLVLRLNKTRQMLTCGSADLFSTTPSCTSYMYVTTTSREVRTAADWSCAS